MSIFSSLFHKAAPKASAAVSRRNAAPIAQDPRAAAPRIPSADVQQPSKRAPDSKAPFAQLSRADSSRMAWQWLANLHEQEELAPGDNEPQLSAPTDQSEMALNAPPMLAKGLGVTDVMLELSRHFGTMADYSTRYLMIGIGSQRIGVALQRIGNACQLSLYNPAGQPSSRFFKQELALHKGALANKEIADWLRTVAANYDPQRDNKQASANRAVFDLYKFEPVRPRGNFAGIQVDALESHLNRREQSADAAAGFAQAIHTAIQRNQPDTLADAFETLGANADWLATPGASLAIANAGDGDGLSPLMHALRAGRHECAGAILRATLVSGGMGWSEAEQQAILLPEAGRQLGLICTEHPPSVAHCLQVSRALERYLLAIFDSSLPDASRKAIWHTIVEHVFGEKAGKNALFQAALLTAALRSRPAWITEKSVLQVAEALCRMSQGDPVFGATASRALETMSSVCDEGGQASHKAAIAYAGLTVNAGRNVVLARQDAGVCSPQVVLRLRELDGTHALCSAEEFDAGHMELTAKAPPGHEAVALFWYRIPVDQLRAAPAQPRN